MLDLEAEIYLEPLPGGAPYVLMPTTFGPGLRGPFSIGVTADGVPLHITPLQDGADARDDEHGVPH